MLIVPSLGRLRTTVQNDEGAELDTQRLFSHLSSKGGNVLSAHLKSESCMQLTYLETCLQWKNTENEPFREVGDM